MTAQDRQTWIIICSILSSSACKALGDGAADKYSRNELSDEDAEKITKFFQKTEAKARELITTTMGIPLDGNGYE